MRELILILVLFLPLVILGQTPFNPKEKKTRGDNIAKVKFRTRAFIDRRITNKAIYHKWSAERERLERDKHPEGGYILLKLKKYSDKLSPLDNFEVWVFNTDSTLTLIYTFTPGRAKNTPSSYLANKNPKIILPLHTPEYVRKLVILNKTRRRVQEIEIIVPSGNTSKKDLRDRGYNYFAR